MDTTIFWDSHGVFLIDYLQKGKTLKEHTTHHYFKSWRQKLWIYCKIPVSLRQRSHISTVAMANIHELQFHPPYSPDLTSSDIFLFSQLKTERKTNALKLLTTHSVFSSALQKINNNNSRSIVTSDNTLKKANEGRRVGFRQ